jgi:carbonic anhydrase
MGLAMGCVVRDDDWDADDANFRDAFSVQRGLYGKVEPLTHDRVSELPLLLTTKTRKGKLPKDHIHDHSKACQGIQIARNDKTSDVIPGSSRSIQSSVKVGQHVQEALSRLRDGNSRFLAESTSSQKASNASVSAFAAIAYCTPPPIPLDVIFDVSPGEISCSAMLSPQDVSEDDGGTAAIEFALSTQSDLRFVLIMETIGLDDTEDKATKRVWLAVERLLSRSKSLRCSIQKGSICVNACLLDLETCRVTFLGEHVKQREALTNTLRQGLRRYRTKYFVEKDLKPVVPAEEALAILQCGNLRVAHKAALVARSVQNAAKPIASPRSGNQVESDQLDPFAFIFMSYDAHKGEGPPANVLFDVHPSEVAAVSTVPWPTDDSEETYANCTEKEQWKSHVHLAEHLLSTKAPRLLLVLGLVPVGATADEIRKAGERVFQDIWNIFGMSTIIKAGVADGQLQVWGGLYHATAMDGQWQTERHRWTVADGLTQTPPGLVEWLGQHPRQEAIIAAMAGMFPPTTVLSARNLPGLVPPTGGGMASATLQELLAGNRRSLGSKSQRFASEWTQKHVAGSGKLGTSPKAIVLASANGNVRAPERLFDTRPGELLVHRTCGAICGRRQGCAIHSLEEMLKSTSQIPVLFVLGDCNDPAISSAIAQVQCHTDVHKCPNAQLVMEQLAPAVVHALHVTGQDSVGNLNQKELALLTAQLHVLYVMERLHVDSDLVISLVSSGKLEVHGAVVQPDGSLQMLQGPDVQRLTAQRARLDRHKRKGVGLGSEQI